MTDEAASEAGRALVALRWRKTTKAQRIEIGRALVEARWRKRGKVQSKPARPKRNKT